METLDTAFNEYTSHLTSSNFSTIKSIYSSATLTFGQDSYGIMDFSEFIASAKTKISSVSTDDVVDAFNGLVVANRYGGAYNSKKPCGTNIFIATGNSIQVAEDEYTANDTKFTYWRTLNINNGTWYSGGWWW